MRQRRGEVPGRHRHCTRRLQDGQQVCRQGLRGIGHQKAAYVVHGSAPRVPQAGKEKEEVREAHAADNRLHAPVPGPGPAAHSGNLRGKPRQQVPPLQA